MVGSLNIPKGSGRTGIVQLTGPFNSMYKKKSVVEITNYDNMCLARAISVSFAKTHLVSDGEWQTIDKKDRSAIEILLEERKISKRIYKNLCNKHRNDQKLMATKICQMSGVSTNVAAALTDVAKFENALKVRIAVISARLGNRFIRVPENTYMDRPLLYIYIWMIMSLRDIIMG